MSNLSPKKLRTSVLLISVFVILFTSCGKDDSSNEMKDYVGTWSVDYSITDGSRTFQCRSILTLTESTYVDLYQVFEPSTNKWVDNMKGSGTFSVENNTIQFELLEYGISSIDANNKFTGVITSYKSGTQGFEILCSQLGQEKIYSLEYSVSGNKMTLKSDKNKDGDYLDNNELFVYTKQ